MAGDTTVGQTVGREHKPLGNVTHDKRSHAGSKRNDCMLPDDEFGYDRL